MSVRAQLANDIKPHLPKKWKVVPYQTNLDTVDVVTVMLKLSTVERTPAAPLASHTVTFTMTVIEPVTTPGDADDAVDDDLDDLLFALDATENLIWSTATRVTYNDRNPAYDIDLEVVTTPTEGA